MDAKIVKAANYLAWGANEFTEPETVQFGCQRCGNPVRFPVAVNQKDAETMAKIIDIADEYLQEKGASAKMLEEIILRCYASLKAKGKLLPAPDSIQ